MCRTIHCFADSLVRGTKPNRNDNDEIEKQKTAMMSDSYAQVKEVAIREQLLYQYSLVEEHSRMYEVSKVRNLAEYNDFAYFAKSLL